MLRVEVFDMRGQLVRTLANAHHVTGRYRVLWDGHGNDDLEVASGTYLVVVRSGGYVQTHKVMLMK